LEETLDHLHARPSATRCLITSENHTSGSLTRSGCDPE
jgi:hypothetical protein